MKLVAQKDNFEIWFNTNTQSYQVFKDGKLLVQNRYKFSDVKSYID
jgi:succinylglutamate desuccinylase